MLILRLHCIKTKDTYQMACFTYLSVLTAGCTIWEIFVHSVSHLFRNCVYASQNIYLRKKNLEMHVFRWQRTLYITNYSNLNVTLIFVSLDCCKQNIFLLKIHFLVISVSTNSKCNVLNMSTVKDMVMKWRFHIISDVFKVWIDENLCIEIVHDIV
jgi:hypothetical protein